MNKSEVISRIVECGVIPVIRASSKEEAHSVIDAIVEGGITCIEVTMTVPGAVQLIAELSKTRDDLLIGAGSVLEAETARECINAGAKFIVSPATNFDTIVYCNESEVAVMPGALTPTEIVNAWDAGADFVKVFPISAVGGAKYLKSIKAPLPHIKIIPTGGADQTTIGELIKAGADAVGVGSDLADVSAIHNGRSADITSMARKYLSMVAEARRT